MKVHEIMTAHARCVSPDNTLVEAAGLMRQLDVGALPVCDDDKLRGMVTDRDLVLRGVADGRDPNTTSIRDVMSQGVIYVLADQPVEEAVQIMENRQIRRLPVLNRGKRMVGIVSLGDIATSSNPAFSGMALRDVSMPAEPSARQQRLAARSGGNLDVARDGDQPRRPSGKRRSTAKTKTATRSRTSRESSSEVGAAVRGGARKRAGSRRRAGSTATNGRGTRRKRSAAAGRSRRQK